MYDLAQPAKNLETIAHSDKELIMAVQFMTEFATETTFRIEPDFSFNPRPYELSDNQYENMSADFDFETFYENEFIEVIFGAEPLLKKDEFVA